VIDANENVHRTWDLQSQQPDHPTPSLRSRWTLYRWNYGNGGGQTEWNPLGEGKALLKRTLMLASPAHRANSFHKEAGCLSRPITVMDIEV